MTMIYSSVQKPLLYRIDNMHRQGQAGQALKFQVLSSENIYLDNLQPTRQILSFYSYSVVELNVCMILKQLQSVVKCRNQI